MIPSRSSADISCSSSGLKRDATAFWNLGSLIAWCSALRYIRIGKENFRVDPIDIEGFEPLAGIINETGNLLPALRPMRKRLAHGSGTIAHLSSGSTVVNLPAVQGFPVPLVGRDV